MFFWLTTLETNYLFPPLGRPQPCANPLHLWQAGRWSTRRKEGVHRLLKWPCYTEITAALGTEPPTWKTNARERGQVYRWFKHRWRREKSSCLVMASAITSSGQVTCSGISSTVASADLQLIRVRLCLKPVIWFPQIETKVLQPHDSGQV